MSSAEEFINSFGFAKRKEYGRTAGSSSIKLPSGNLLPDDQEVRSAISSAADEFGVPQSLLFALANQESSYNPEAVGVSTPYGKAKGMFQYIDDTANRLGIDPFDYKQAARAAAKQMKERLKKGTRWAIGAHFAGDDPKQHGSKTSQYIEEVLAKASVISQQLQQPFEISNAPDEVDEPAVENTAENFIASFDSEPAEKKPNVTQSVEPKLKTLGQTISEIPERIAEGPVSALTAVAKGWEGLKSMLNREYTTVRLENPAEIQNEYYKIYGTQIARGFPVPTLEEYTASNPTKQILANSYKDEELQWRKRIQQDPKVAALLPARFSHLKPQRDLSNLQPANTIRGMVQRYIEGAGNPVDLLLNESLPANAISYLTNLPEFERKQFDETRAIVQQLNIDANPDQFPAEAVTAARKAIAERKAKTTPGMWEATKQMFKAVMADPGSAIAEFQNMLVADPELAFVPGGQSVKPLQAIRAARTYNAAARAGVSTAMTQAGKVTRLADSILGVGSAEAAYNVGVGAGQQLAQTGQLDAKTMQTDAALGFVLGGGLGALGQTFTRSAKARAKSLDAHRAEGTLQQALDDQAKADIEVEDALSGLSFGERTLRTEIQRAAGEVERGAFGTGANETPLQQQLRQLFGIRSKADADKAIKQRRDDIRKAFTNESDYADYLRAVADARLAKAEELAAAEAAREAEAAATAQASADYAAARRERWQSEFDKATAERDRLAEENLDLAWTKHEEAQNIAARLNAEELLDAHLTGDNPTIKQMEAKVARRDAGLNTPKWKRGYQEGYADPELLARTAVVGAGVLTGAALYDENRMAGGILGGLAGLLVPAGGSVLRRMKQSGAIDISGNPIAQVIVDGHLANKVETEAKTRADSIKMDAGKSGNLDGFNQLYEEYQPQILRYTKRVLASRGDRGKIDPEDIVQEAFLKTFEYLRDGGTIDNFPAFVKTVAERTASNYDRARKTAKRGAGREEREGDLLTADDYEGVEHSSPSIYDQAIDNPDYTIEGMTRDTVEDAAVRDDTIDIIRQAMEGMSDRDKQIFDLVHMQDFEIRDVAAQLGMEEWAVRKAEQRGMQKIKDAIANNRKSFSPDTQSSKDQLSSRNDLVQLYHTTPEIFYETIKREGIRGFSPAEINKAITKDLGIPLTEDLLNWLDDNYWMGEARSTTKRGPFFTSSKSRTAEIRGDTDIGSIGEGPAAIARDIGFYLENIGDLEGAKKAFAYEDKIRKSPAKTISLLIPRKELTGVFGPLPEDLSNFSGDIITPGRIIRAPRGQRGEISPEGFDAVRKTALVAGIAGTAGTAGYFLSDGDLWDTAKWATAGALTSAFLGKGHGTKMIRGLDHRLGDLSPELHGLAKRHGKNELQRIRNFNLAAQDFVQWFHGIDRDIKPIVIRALSTRKKGVIDAVLKQTGGDIAVNAFSKLRQHLDKVEDELVSLGLIKKSEDDYFPFRVKDLEGLRKALGVEASDAIDIALRDARKTAGRELTEIEQDRVINKVLEPYLGKKIGSSMPGFAKARTIQEIPEHLQKFYYDPIETLNSYGVSSSKYIERAKFFGKNLKTNKKGEQLYLNLDESIGTMVRDLEKSGQLTRQKAYELAELLRVRFGPGEEPAGPVVRAIKSGAYIPLLSQFGAVMTQLGDGIVHALRNNPVDTVRAAVRIGTKNKYLDLSDLGLTEHLTHEYMSTGWLDKAVKFSMTYSGFKAIDNAMASMGVNTVISKFMRKAQTEKGKMELADEFERFYPEEFKKAIADLERGKVGPEVELMAYTYLTETRPATAWELPQYYHSIGGSAGLGRLLYTLQTFNVRALNVVHQHAIKDLVSGDWKKFRRGAKWMLGLAAIYGTAGATTEQLKGFINSALTGDEFELDPMSIPTNVLEMLGISMYDYKQMDKSNPITGALESKVPATFRIAKEVLDDPKSTRNIRYIPLVGNLLYRLGNNPALMDKTLKERDKERKKREGYRMYIDVPAKPEGSSDDRRGRRRRRRRER